MLTLTVQANVLLAGDANRDGRVQFDDFLLLSDNFGRSSVAWSEGDFDRDGSVLFSDFLQLSNNFGSMTSESTPEPSGWLMAVWALLIVGQWRRLK